MIDRPGSALEKARECANLAELHEHNFNVRKLELRDKAATSPHAQNRPTSIDMLTDRLVAEDPDCRRFIGLNQWYISQATMYGILALLEKR